MSIESISNYYNTISPSYNELYTTEQYTKYDISLPKDNDESNEIKVMLDIGMGSGLLVKYLENKISRKSIYYIGIDISYTLITRAPQNTKSVQTDYILCDGEKLPIRIEPIDLLTLYTVIHHFQEPEKFIKNMSGNYSSTLIISFLGHSPEEINEILKGYKNRLINSLEISIYNYRNRERIYVIKYKSPSRGE